MAADVVHRFPADFKKVPGQLTITSTHIAWVPKEPGSMDRQNQAMSRVINMLASKAGSAKVSLKLVFRDDLPAGGLHFTFTNPRPEAREDDRKVVQDTLIPFVSANRNGPAAAAPTPPAVASNPGTPSAVLGKRKSTAANGDDSAVSSPGPAAGKARPEVYRLRIKVLKKNPTLAILHKELVQGKQITEAEFWEGREALIRAEELAQAQKPGRQSRLLDDRFDLSSKRDTVGASGTGVGVKTKADSGPQVISLTKELVSEIFDEFPVVQDAYVRYVPGISEAEFWSRYFQSQLWERHRASVRQSASDEISKRKDEIFDQYLEEPDWNVQPRKQQPDNVERFLDLAATEEDHGETVTQRDVTMQAGRERGALPLIRRFNDHSGKLLRRGREETSTGGHLNTILPEDIDIYNEIDLEDLRGPALPSTIQLEVADEQEKDGDNEGNQGKGIMPGKSDEELVDFLAQYTSSITEYHHTFESISIPTPAGGWEKNRQESNNSAEQTKLFERHLVQKLGADGAAGVVREMYLAANAEHAVTTPFPDTILEQMRSCHNAATEFLRQYWSAILPLPVGALGGPSSAPAVRAAKAEKMAGYLRLTEGKVEAVINTATGLGVDPARVRTALAPTLGAVGVALKREDRRRRD